MGLPERVGRLRLIRPVGAGGFATVWLARDDELQSDVAVKVLAENWAQRADVRERFVAEARLLRRIDSDGIVRVYDVGELPDGRPWLAMTYADRGSLADRLPWSGGTERALEILEQVADSLNRLHARGIVHRDLTPANVLFVADAQARRGEGVLLADLGLAKDLSFASGLTEPAGTGRYRAPEQLEFSAAIGPATDVYALATVAAELLGPSDQLTPAVDEVLERARHRDPGKRTADSRALVRALRAESPVGHEALGRRRAPRPIALAGAVALAAGAAAYVLLWPRTTELATTTGAVLTLPGTGWEVTAYAPPNSPTAVGRQGVKAGRQVGLAALLEAASPERLDALAAAPTHPGCGSHTRRDVRLAAAGGAVHDWTQCPDGTTHHEIALAGPGDQVVLLSVTAKEDALDLLGLLASLRWPPTASRTP